MPSPLSRQIYLLQKLLNLREQVVDNTFVQRSIFPDVENIQEKLKHLKLRFQQQQVRSHNLSLVVADAERTYGSALDFAILDKFRKYKKKDASKAEEAVGEEEEEEPVGFMVRFRLSTAHRAIQRQEKEANTPNIKPLARRKRQMQTLTYFDHEEKRWKIRSPKVSSRLHSSEEFRRLSVHPQAFMSAESKPKSVTKQSTALSIKDPYLSNYLKNKKNERSKEAIKGFVKEKPDRRNGSVMFGELKKLETPIFQNNKIVRSANQPKLQPIVETHQKMTAISGAQLPLVREKIERDGHHEDDADSENSLGSTSLGNMGSDDESSVAANDITPSSMNPESRALQQSAQEGKDHRKPMQWKYSEHVDKKHSEHNAKKEEIGKLEETGSAEGVPMPAQEGEEGLEEFQACRYMYRLCNCRRVTDPQDLLEKRARRRNRPVIVAGTIEVYDGHGAGGDVHGDVVCPYCVLEPAWRIQRWLRSLETGKTKGVYTRRPLRPLRAKPVKMR